MMNVCIQNHESLYLKMMIFALKMMNFAIIQFVNNYFTLFYIAFLIHFQVVFSRERS